MPEHSETDARGEMREMLEHLDRWAHDNAYEEYRARRQAALLSHVLKLVVIGLLWGFVVFPATGLTWLVGLCVGLFLLASFAGAAVGVL